ncbi:hypothetical protein [Kitasatospora sp. CB02891]|uniref:hypothetical protein n=1 Tax=Kitasatospora sp. CB02891 TaxID=2020329 RepID=UPI000C26E802|nr:hypothetical protein [Kitasatospora sp. CB02891]PJN24039.1 hypothetical protein CG736_19270 [Kitasatospora sp. CB02891]
MPITPIPGQLAFDLTPARGRQHTPTLTRHEYLTHLATGTVHIYRPTIWDDPHLHDPAGHPIARITLTDLVDLELDGLIRRRIGRDHPTTLTDLGRQALATAA